jgi:hypothetical protein
MERLLSYLLPPDQHLGAGNKRPRSVSKKNGPGAIAEPEVLRLTYKPQTGREGAGSGKGKLAS